MLVSDDSALVGNGYDNFRILLENDTLTAQPAFKPWIDGAIDKIFFFVRNFFQKLIAFFHIQMAGGAGANAATIVIEVHIVFLGQFQDRHVHKITRNCFARDAGIFKLKSNGCHGRASRGVQR